MIPHPAFIGAWTLWWCGVLSYHFLDQPWQALVWLTGFFLFETIAFKVHPAFTLSWCVAWCMKHPGWGLIGEVVSVPIGLLITRICVDLVPVAWGGWSLGISLGVLTVLLLHRHWWQLVRSARG